MSTCPRRPPRLAVAAGLFISMFGFGCAPSSDGAGTGSGGRRGGGGVSGSGGAVGSGSGGSADTGSGGATGTGGAGSGGTGSGGTGSGGSASGGAIGSGGAGSGGSTGSGGATSGSGGTAGSGSGGRGSGGTAGQGGQAGGGAGGAGGITPGTDAAYCAEQLDAAAATYKMFRQTYSNASQIPRSYGSSARLVGVNDWTSGFPAGSYWLLYEHTRDDSWRTAAEARTAAVMGQRNDTSTHDVGFIINCSYGNGYRLTQNASYKTVITDAARSLGTRFNATVGATRSWSWGSWSFPVIIDNMMNLELLYRATAVGGDAKYAMMGASHAATTLKNHFRADASSYHLVDYNPSSGAVVKKQTEQGLANESAWARGQTWGLYGFTMSYRETKDAQFLEQAKKIADFWTMNSGMPADAVPYFDFDAPKRSDVPDHRDTSAAAIAASALLELAGYVTDAAAASRYRMFAIKSLRSLSSSAYRSAPGSHGHFLLFHAVGNYPDNEEVDVSLNYGDYYYLEALLRCSKL